MFKKNHIVTDEMKRKISNTLREKKAVYIKFRSGYIFSTYDLARLLHTQSGVIKQKIVKYGYIVIHKRRYFGEIVTNPTNPTDLHSLIHYDNN